MRRRHHAPTSSRRRLGAMTRIRSRDRPDRRARDRHAPRSGTEVVLAGRPSWCRRRWPTCQLKRLLTEKARVLSLTTRRAMDRRPPTSITRNPILRVIAEACDGVQAIEAYERLVLDVTRAICVCAHGRRGGRSPDQREARSAGALIYSRPKRGDTDDEI